MTWDNLITEFDQKNYKSFFKELSRMDEIELENFCEFIGEEKFNFIVEICDNFSKKLSSRMDNIFPEFQKGY